ncbi:hypothetical protein C9J19_03810 [Photobacterium phosphoreum]|nr:hypothetical protein C9J19_03810 [Photobacterium phosphoreum]
MIGNYTDFGTGSIMHKQIIKNILYNGFSFVTNLIITLLLTPYLVNNLGVIAYGFIPLAMIFTAYIGIITESFTISINRNLTKAFQSGNFLDANKIFNTALFTVLALIMFLLLSLSYPIINLNTIIDIPIGLNQKIKILFCFFIFSFLLSLITAVFSVSMYALNRIDLIQINSILRNIVKTVSLVLFFKFDDADVIYMGYSVLIASFASLIYSVVQFNKLTPELFIKLSFFNRSKVINLLNMGGWLLINQIGFVLFMKVDLLIVNKLISPENSGLYAIALQFSDVLRVFAGIISGVLGPAVIILYSQCKILEMNNLTKLFVRFLSLTISIPIIVICVYSKEILFYWMGSDYISLSPLIWLLTLPLVINLGVQPLFSIQVAMNKIKVPAILNLTFGLIGVLLSIFLIKNTTLGYYAVALSSILMLTLKNAFATPLYTAFIMNEKGHDYLFIHVKTVIFTALSMFFLEIFKSIYYVDTLISLILSLLFSFVMLTMLSFVFYSQSDKNKFIKLIKEKYDN